MAGAGGVEDGPQQTEVGPFFRTIVVVSEVSKKLENKPKNNSNHWIKTNILLATNWLPSLLIHNQNTPPAQNGGAQAGTSKGDKAIENGGETN